MWKAYEEEINIGRRNTEKEISESNRREKPEAEERRENEKSVREEAYIDLLEEAENVSLQCEKMKVSLKIPWLMKWPVLKYNGNKYGNVKTMYLNAIGQKANV